MAFKKGQSTSFNPATIQVNRGQGLRQLGASIGELGSANSRGVNNFINNRLNEMEAKEKKLGKKLGKQAQIIYENQTFTDEKGNTRTHKIASNYETPEELLRTSWSASAYDEEAADTYVKAVSLSASQILDDEKLLAIQNVKYSDTVGEHIAMFDKAVAEPMEALLSTVPPEMRSIVEADFKNQARIRRTDLANKQLTRRIAYDDATATNVKTQWADIAPSLALSNIGDYTEQLAQITKRMTILANKQGLNSTAAMWLENELPTYQLLGKTGENLSKYILHNNNDANSINRSINNIQRIRMGINNPTQAITLERPDGSTENVTFKSLGFGKVDGLDMTKVDSFLNTHQSFLNDMNTQAEANETTMRIVNIANATGYPQEMSKTELENLSIAFTDYNSQPSISAIARFAASFDPPRNYITPEYLSTYAGAGGPVNTGSTANEVAMYHEFLAVNYAVLPRDMTIALESGIKNIQSASANEATIENFVNSPAFVLAQSAVVMDEDKNITTRNILSYLKLPEGADITIQQLTRHISNHGNNVKEGVEAYVKERDLTNQDGYHFASRKDLNDAFATKNTGDNPFNTIIIDAILGEFSDVLGKDDVFVSQNFAKRIEDQTYEYYRSFSNVPPSSSQVESKAIQIGRELINNNTFGKSKYVISNTSLISPNAGDFIGTETIGDSPTIVMYPLDKYFDVSPERARYNRRFSQAYGGVGIDESQTAFIINKQIRDRTTLLETKNPNYKISDDLKVGETVFFECINKHNITRPEQAVYQLKYLNRGVAEPVYDDNDNTIVYTQKYFEEIYKREGTYFNNKGDLKLENVPTPAEYATMNPFNLD